MSVQAIGWVLDFSTAEGYERLALLSIANHAQADGSGAWPSYDTIAREAHMSRRRAIDCIARLEAQGHIAVARGAGPKGRTGRATNLYAILGMVTERHHLAAVNGDANGDARDLEMVTLASPEPSLEPQNPRAREESPASASPSAEDLAHGVALIRDWRERHGVSS